MNDPYWIVPDNINIEIWKEKIKAKKITREEIEKVEKNGTWNIKAYPEIVEVDGKYYAVTLDDKGRTAVSELSEYLEKSSSYSLR